MSLTHRWDLAPGEAVALQKELRDRIRLEPLAKEVRLVAGADISFNKYSDTVYAGIIVLDLSTLHPVAHSLVVTRATFPYIPGLLSFREIPALLEAWEQLKVRPDVLMLDGQGIAHPRGMGIAAHMGLMIDLPTVGCAKSLLYGHYREPGLTRGSRTALMAADKKIGYVLRTKDKVKPLIISPGHKITFTEANELVLRCTTKYRLPETTRRAHILVNALRTGEEAAGYKEYRQDQGELF